VVGLLKGALLPEDGENNKINPLLLAKKAGLKSQLSTLRVRIADNWLLLTYSQTHWNDRKSYLWRVFVSMGNWYQIYYFTKFSNIWNLVEITELRVLFSTLFSMFWICMICSKIRYLGWFDKFHWHVSYEEILKDALDVKRVTDNEGQATPAHPVINNSTEWASWSKVLI